MDHTQAREFASAALEDSLTGDQERELAVHLIACSECKAHYDALTRARGAFRQVSRTDPEAEVVEVAVARSTTVLRGEADPGIASEAPMATGEDTGPLRIGDIGPPPEPAPFEPSPLEPSPFDEPPGEPEPQPPPLLGTAVEPATTEPDLWDRTDAPPVSWGPTDQAEQPSVPGPVVFEEDQPQLIEVPVTEGPQPLEADPGTFAEPYEPAVPAPVVRHEPPGPDDEQRRAGPWIIGIAVAIAVAVVAGFLVTRGGDVLESTADLPTADDVRSGVNGIFDDLQSIKASYTITRLSLWRLRQEDERLVYSFSNGVVSGRYLAEDEPARSREERILEVQGDELSRSTSVDTGQERRTLLTQGRDTHLTVEANPPFGPPDGELEPRFGVLGPAVGAAARLLVDASDLRVIERTSHADTDVYRVRFSVAPSEYTRADRIEALLEVQTFMPLQIRRSISRAEAQVLGPSELLGPDAIEAAFGERDRITTELVELRSVVIDDVILSGEFVLDVQEGTPEETADAGFRRVSRAELRQELAFEPLLPATLPVGFREREFAVYTGPERAWGPNGIYPAPEGIMQATYSDGKTTIVVTARRQADGAFEVNESPLAGGGLPLVERSVVRGGRRMTYAISPEVPPHVYGWVDNVFVLVSGYAPPDDLIRIAASMAPEELSASPPADEPAGSPPEVVVPRNND